MNDRIENLQKMTRSEHIRLHHKNKILSEKTRKKISKIRIKKGLVKDEKNGMFNKHHLEETKRKISESKKGKMRGKDNPFFDKYHTAENIKKMKMTKLKNKIKAGKHKGIILEDGLYKVKVNNCMYSKYICQMSYFEEAMKAFEDYNNIL